MKAFTAIDLESMQGYCIRICQFELEVVENGMITQEVHLVAPGNSQIGKGKGCYYGRDCFFLFTEAKEIYLNIDELGKQFDSLLVIDFKSRRNTKQS
jgi:hypothetical protein